MRRSKDRLHRVMVIGATPSGIAAVNKLGELNIPVTLVDAEANLDKKLAREEYRLRSGIRFNHGYRPGLIRIMRNPSINCVLPARVNSVTHTRQGFDIAITRIQTFVDADRCVLCGRCEDICPVTEEINGETLEKALQFEGRGSLPGRPTIDKRRSPLCRQNCPLDVNAQGYIALARKGKYGEALALIRERNILPGVCGRICVHPCETDCRRGDVDDTVSVRAIKRFLSDWGAAHPEAIKLAPAPETRKEKFAVIGSGPAGLAAAAEFARCGCRVTLFDKEKKAGGLLRYGIGPHRLPRHILDSELRYIEDLGVEFVLEETIDLATDLHRMRGQFDGIVIASGSWHDRLLGVEGEDLEGITGCLSFLGRFHRGEIAEPGGKVAVIGDGNAAFDLARTLVRIGAEVTIVSWFGKDMIPADSEEIRWATEEGITIIDRCQVIAFLGRDGRFQRLLCMPTQPGPENSQGIAWPVPVENSKPFSLLFDKAFVAIGQAGGLTKPGGLNINDFGFIDTDADHRTSLSNIFAAGDAVSGPSTVVHAMALGRAAAVSALAQVCDIHLEKGRPQRPADRDFRDIPEGIPSQDRAAMVEMQAWERNESFSEVARGLSESQVIYESGRCLQCGACAECMQCEDVCSAIGAICHAEQEEKSVESAGALIIADKQMAPAVCGEDVIRAYGPNSAKPDAHAMVMRGFSAAARAMVQLGNSSDKGTGCEVSITVPDPPLSDDIRIGVFVCRCNDSQGWLEDLDRFTYDLMHEKDISHAEVITSACLPDQVAKIVNVVRAKRLTRLVIGSCVCCSLDFVCSACTDQRSRLKHNLFTATGISRSMVVPLDIRSDVLSYLEKEPGQALSRFETMLRHSIQVARGLKPIVSTSRSYNYSTAVIGITETAVHAALTLGGMNINVCLFTESGKAPADVREHPGIHCFEKEKVNSISGTLGDFRLDVDGAGGIRTVDVGAVIVADKPGKKIRYTRRQGLLSRKIEFGTQEQGVAGEPFLEPGMTPVAGIFVANPPGVRISNRQKGRAAGLLAAVAMVRGPRKNRGHTVVIDHELCRGCGRCAVACPYQAVTLVENELGLWCASVDEPFCRGCGNCIAVCPSGAADSPCRSRKFLEDTLETVLA